MLKNPNKRKVNATKVTWMTWIPKDSAHGSRGGLMKLKSDTTSMSTSHSTSASPCKDPTNNSNVSTLIKQTGSTPQLLFQGSTPWLWLQTDKTDVDTTYKGISQWWRASSNSSSSKQTYNDYLWEWLNYKEEFLECLLQMEAPPNPRECSNCRIEGTYRCSDCFGWPMFCTACCQNEHQRLPFHWIEQWTGSFFEESSLTLVIHPSISAIRSYCFTIGKSAISYISGTMDILVSRPIAMMNALAQKITMNQCKDMCTQPI